jgi:hypothetical protein
MESSFVTKLLIFFLLSSPWINDVWAQECPERDYKLSSQADVEALGSEGCSSISGNLSIVKDYGSTTGITDLNSLTALANVDGDLAIYGSSNGLYTTDWNANDEGARLNLDGLTNLFRVGGDLRIFGVPLTDLNGLRALTTVGRDLRISYNSALVSIGIPGVDGLINLTRVGGRLQIRDNPSLTNLAGLSSLNEVRAQLIIHNNRVLSSCLTTARLLGWPDKQDAVEYFSIQGNALGCNSRAEIYQEAFREWAGSENCPDALYTLTSQAEVDEFGALGCPMMRGRLAIGKRVGNTIFASDISDLSALSGLREIKGSLVIYALATSSLQGLHNLASVGGLEVLPIFEGGPSSLTALQNLQHVGGPLAVVGSLSQSLEGLNNVSGFTSVLLLANRLTDCSAIASEMQKLPLDKIQIIVNSGGCNTVGEVLPSVPFLERFYTNILGRPSDEAGLGSWFNVINTQSASTVALGFLNSAEFKNKGLDDAAFVDILYRTLFDRAGDAGGTSYWLEQLAAGKLRDMVIWGFLRAAEFKTLSDSFGVTALNAADESAYGIRAFVERFYTLVLGRQPDAGGFDNWVIALTNGSYAGGDIVKAFFLSAEYLSQNTSDDAFVSTCYQAFFGREAGAAGKQGWLDALAQGSSRTDVLNGFIGSAEFAALASSYGIKASRASAGMAAESARMARDVASPIPTLPVSIFLILSGLLALFAAGRLRAA